MITTKSAPKPGEGVWLWLIKIISGGLIIIFLVTHFIVNHLSGTAEGGLLTFREIIQFYTSPAYLVLEILFLITVVSHALIGFRSVILDLNLVRSAMTVIDWLLLILGVGSVVYGIWLVLTIAAQAA
jgi:succinate dehydrogenase/fumarate reductase cytochrome b subunit